MAESSVRIHTRRRALKITAAAGASLALGGGLATGLFRLATLKRVSSTRTQMGTRVTITVVHPDGDAARSLVDTAFEEIDRLEGILSRHRTGTAVDRLNREGILRNSPPELTHLLEESRRYSDMTSGAFDSTIAPVLRLYEKRASSPGGLPEPAEVEQALGLVDYRQVRIEGSVVSLGRVGMSITLDGLAKGYIVDRASEALVGGGAKQVMVDAGGDVASVGGGATSGGWRLGVQDPRDSQGILGVVRLRDEGVATSGDYMQPFANDLTHHHILDPRTGRSPEETSGVTVVAPTAMEADALSTSVFVLGPSAGLDLLDRLDGREGMIVTKAQQTLASRGFDRYLD